jgi:two-component system, chemotaxis family, chemotaxis protein CheY
MEKRAIIVDDELATCELIEKVLTSAGIESLTVTKSKEAPEILRHGRFAVAFLDYHMDFPDGRVLARQMRASGSNRGTPIVMISDDQRPGAVSEGFEAGASFFLYKPVDKDRLQKLVRATQATIESGMRRTRRVELKSKVSIRFRGQEIEGQTINVSMEGMLIRTGEPAVAGAFAAIDCDVAGVPRR